MAYYCCLSQTFIFIIIYPLQFFDRLTLFAMPAKHQPDFVYLRHVPLRKVHLFTIIQLSCLVLLWLIKTSKAAIVFPMMVCKQSNYIICRTITQAAHITEVLAGSVCEYRYVTGVSLAPTSAGVIGGN